MVDTLHDDPDLAARSLVAQKLAGEIAAQAANTLHLMGYELVVVRIARIVRGKDGECGLPGATASIADPAMAPCLPLEAEELRHLAARFDAEFARLKPGSEADRGYVEECDPAEFGL